MNEVKNIRPLIAAFLLSMATTLCSGTISFFITPVSESLNIGHGTFSLYYSICSIVGALSGPFLGRIVDRFGMKKMTAVSAFWCSTGFLLFSISNSIYQIYVIAFCMGFLMELFVTMGHNVVIQTHYNEKKAAQLLGIASLGGSASSIAANMTIPNFIAAYGWRNAYRLHGFLWFVIVFGAFIALSGCNPIEVEKSENTNSAQKNKKVEKKAERKGTEFLLMMLYMACVAASCCIVIQFSPIMEEMNFTATEIGLIFSFQSVIGIGIKVIQGTLFKKIGVMKIGPIALIIFICSFLMLPYKNLILVTMAFFSAGSNIVMTHESLFARKLFGSENYASLWGTMLMASSLGAIVITPFWGALYDYTGSYKAAMVICPMFLCIAMCIQLFLKKKIKENE